MKREALNHTKMKRLCRRLDVPLYQAVGILETLWNLTSRQAIQGDIGKLTNEDIALGIDYRGDENQLVECLVHSGWLDLNARHRLVIHDWAHHADDSVHMRLARARSFFWDGSRPKITRIGGKERESIASFYGSPEPPHLPMFDDDNINDFSSSCALNQDPCARNVDSSKLFARNGDSCTPPLPLPLPLPLPKPEDSAVIEGLVQREKEESQHQSISVAFLEVVGRPMKKIDVECLTRIQKLYTEPQIEAGIYVAGIRAVGLGKKPGSLAYFENEIAKTEASPIQDLGQYISYLKKKLATARSNGGAHEAT